MSCKAAIYTASTSTQNIEIDVVRPTHTLPLGGTIRRFGRNIRLSGDNISLEGEGYYKVDASVTLTPNVAGNYTISLLEDGVVIPGAIQTVTITDGVAITFNIPALIRLQCCKSSSILTLAVSTTATLPLTVRVNNVGVVVEKI